VTTPQQIVKKMTEENYCVVIFGDIDHPEVKGVMSYGDDNITVVLNAKELENVKFKKDKIATVAQTTRKKEEYLEIVNYLVLRHKEVRVFNTICDATFENQDAARTLSKEVDVMVVVGGKNSSNTKQLFTICEENIKSYLVEDENDLKPEWFLGKNVCGITAGASTPDWIIRNIIDKLKAIQ
jgi:4-hydroxy-3-methylbut-2-enyl diphosphate reductase